MLAAQCWHTRAHAQANQERLRKSLRFRPSLLQRQDHLLEEQAIQSTLIRQAYGPAFPGAAPQARPATAAARMMNAGASGSGGGSGGGGGSAASPHWREMAARDPTFSTTEKVKMGLAAAPSQEEQSPQLTATPAAGGAAAAADAAADGDAAGASAYHSDYECEDAPAVAQPGAGEAAAATAVVESALLEVATADACDVAR
jgi:hypothetical protein